MNVEEQKKTLQERIKGLKDALDSSSSLPGGVYTAIAIGNTWRELRAAEYELAQLMAGDAK